MANNRNDLQLDLLDVENASEIPDGDQLRNINSYEYLKNIADQVDEELDIFPLSYIKSFFAVLPDYRPDYPYGDLYTDFLVKFENAIQTIEKAREKKEAELRLKIAQLETFISLRDDPTNVPFKSLFIASIKHVSKSIDDLRNQIISIDNTVNCIYANPNLALERSTKMIEDVIANQDISHTSSSIESAVRERMKGKSRSALETMSNDFNYFTSYRDVNKTTPQQEGSNTGRLSAMLSNTFKPQMTTSLASIRTYEYKNQGNNPSEYRFGTQGQFEEKQARVSPMFEAWLRVQQRKRDAEELPEESPKTRVTHIYFNNLGLDRTGYEGEREKQLTLQLHGLESKHGNIAVITLPADKGLMDKKLLSKHRKTINAVEAYTRMLDIATGVVRDPNPDTVRDFYISDDTKKLLYGAEQDPYNKDREQLVINQLLLNSFAALGLEEVETISSAEMQAVYFHFIKFELTNFIIEKLQPESFNMSCKDAIDRGGVSSAYYNLMKSLETGAPLSQAEFYRALHGAPTLVKGRGMNHHTQLIWNAVNAYVNSTNQDIVRPPQWLVEWRNDHAPKSSRENVIQQLTDYLQKRGQDQRNLHSFFGKYNKATKVMAATKLLNLLKEPDRNDITFTSQEWGALKDGRLSKVVADIKELGILDLNRYNPNRVQQTPTMRFD